MVCYMCQWQHQQDDEILGDFYQILLNSEEISENFHQILLNSEEILGNSH